MTSKGLKIVGPEYDFSVALKTLKRGAKVSRTNSGGNWFIFLVPGSNFTVNRAPLNTILSEGEAVNYRAHIDIMYDINFNSNKVAVWTPNVTELLAEDWVEVDTIPVFD